MEILRNRWKQMQLRLLLSVSVLMGIGAGFPKEAWAEMEEQAAEPDNYLEVREEDEEPGRESAAAAGRRRKAPGILFFLTEQKTGRM